MPSSILLLSADPDATALVTSTLRGHGHRVTAREGSQAALTDVGDAELVILDRVERPADAADICRRIRSTPELAGLLILAIAQTDEADERIRLLEAGADDVMAKPIDVDELEARVDGLVTRSGRSRQLTSDVAPAPTIQRGRVIAFYSPKGGAGTTSIAVNVALASAELVRGARALIDLDLQWGDVAAHLDLRPSHSVTDLARDTFALHDRATMESYASEDPSGLWVFAGPGRPEVESPLRAEEIASLLNGIRAAYEIAFVDAGSELDERTLTVLEHADRIVIPVVPEIPALRAVHSLLDALARLDGVSDRAVFVLNHLAQHEALSTGDIERTFGARPALELPYDPVVYHKAANEGEPVVRGAAAAPAAAALRRLTALALDLPMEPEAPARGSRLVRSLLRRGRSPGSSDARSDA
jgi:pilus assembly protein CpaE